MRMFALVTEAYGGEGGIAQYNRDFFDALSKVNPNNHVIFPRIVRTKISKLPPNIIQLRSLRGRFLYALNAFYSIKQKGPFDIIFCGHLNLAPLAALLSNLFRLPIWLQIHGIDAWEKPSFLKRWAAERASLVTAVSRHTRHKFLRWANIRHHRVRILPNTVQKKFTPGPKAIKIIERYGLKDKKVLLTTGRLSSMERYKGHDKIISILPNLLQKHSDLVYVIAGDGDDSPRLKSLAFEKGVEKSVLFIGNIKDDELPDIYRTADLFVMPSSGEGFGIVFLEAMACGKPVVSGNTDGSMDPLHDGMIGTVASDGKLVQAIETALMSSPIDRYALSHLVQQYFGKNAFAKHLDLLSSMITDNL
jgi:phosphatidylinositol alpha-1,6-mannosyltransferase